MRLKKNLGQISFFLCEILICSEWAPLERHFNQLSYLIPHNNQQIYVSNTPCFNFNKLYLHFAKKPWQHLFIFLISFVVIGKKNQFSFVHFLHSFLSLRRMVKCNLCQHTDLKEQWHRIIALDHSTMLFEIWFSANTIISFLLLVSAKWNM